MKYKELKERCYEANMQIPKQKLAIYTFGNVSAREPESDIFAIKPSGLPYSELTPESMVIVDLQGQVIDGNLRPSSDTLSHAVLYAKYPEIGGIVHTHSTYATAWAQAIRSVPIYGTTHADHLAGDIPVTKVMSDTAITGNYEEETGYQMVEAIEKSGWSIHELEMILVASHGPFTWGKTCEKAVYNAAVLEELCRMATLTERVNPEVKTMKKALIDKHYQRKHGAHAYYGQL